MTSHADLEVRGVHSTPGKIGRVCAYDCAIRMKKKTKRIGSFYFIDEKNNTAISRIAIRGKTRIILFPSRTRRVWLASK